MRRKILVLTALVGILVIGAADPAVARQPWQCGRGQICQVSGSLDCMNVTSLEPAVYDPYYRDMRVETDNNNCGVEECYIWFYCGCGKPPSTLVCTEEY